MDDAVLYRLLPHATLPHGPVSIILSPTGKIRICVDERYLDPSLAELLNQVSGDIMRPRTLITDGTTPPNPPDLRITRVSDTGSGMVAAEVTPTLIDVLIDKELIGTQIPGPLAAQGAAILRRFA